MLQLDHRDGEMLQLDKARKSHSSHRFVSCMFGHSL